MSRSLQVLAFAGLCVLSQPAAAEPQISVFGGANWNLSSDVKVAGTGTHDGTYSVDWDGKSFELPPYWGVRATYWLNNSSSGWGFAIDYVHAKAVADLSKLGGTFDRLEFTDGNNILLFDVLYRFNPWMGGKVVPYLGAGVGVAIPHVEVTLTGGQNTTYEYQLTGIAAQVLAGLEYKLNEKWSVFAEGRFSYSNVVSDLNGGGTLKTHLWEPQLAIGLSYRF